MATVFVQRLLSGVKGCTYFMNHTLVTCWRRKPSYMMTYQQRSRHPNMKMLKSQATSTCKNICLLRMPCPVFTFVTIICLSEDCGRQKPHETSCNKHLIEAGLIQSRYITNQYHQSQYGLYQQMMQMFK